MTETIFSKIIDGSMPTEIIYEDEYCLAFNDINPQAPVHVLLIPKQPISQLSQSCESDQKLLGHLLLKAPIIAESLGYKDAFRLVINNGAKAGQTVFHLHLHIIAGRAFSWPPG